MRRGASLVEILVALLILGLVIPVSFGAFGSSFMIGFRMREYADKVAYAEWWFNRLECPVSQTAIEAMPRADSEGRMHFSWTAVGGDYGSIRVVLSVSNGSKSDNPFVISRVY